MTVYFTESSFANDLLTYRQAPTGFPVHSHRARLRRKISFYPPHPSLEVVIPALRDT